MKSTRGNRAGNRFDAFMNLSYGREAADGVLSNEEIRRRQLAEHAADLAAEEKANADAAALAARNAEEERLGISGIMQKAREHDPRYDEQMGKRWRHSCADIKSMVDIMPQAYQFKLHNLPLISSEGFENVSFEQFRKAFHDFLTMKHETEGLTLDDESKEKLGLFIAVQANMFKDQAEGVDPLATGTFEDCLYHLERWNALNVKRTAQPRIEPKPLEITDSTSREHDGKVVYNELVDVAGNLFGAWLHSLSTNFAFVPSKLQLDAAVEMLERLALPLYDRASFDQVRIKLCVKKIWPEQCLTVDEYIAHILMEKYDLNDSRQKQAFKEECNRVRYQSGS